jgi:hypothetical protein
MKKNSYPYYCLLVCSLILTHAKGQDKYFVKTDGTKIELIPANISPLGMMLDNDYLFYYDKKGRQFSIKQSEVKEMVVGPEYYILLPISKKDKRLLKLIASNEKYLLDILDMLTPHSGDVAPF